MPSQAAPFHLGAFFESLDGAATLQNIAAVGDDRLDVSGDNLRIPPELTHIGACYFGSPATTLSRALLTSPSLQGRSLLEIQPLSATTEPGTPPAWMPFFESALPMVAGEVVNLQVDQDNAGAVDNYGLVWLTRGPIARTPPPPGAIWTRFTTAASAMTAAVWNNRQLSAARNLPDGTYEVYGMRGQSTSAVAMRLDTPGSDYKPGVLGLDAVTDLAATQQVFSMLGPWGSFRSDALPRVEVLPTAADNEVQEVDLLIHKVG